MPISARRPWIRNSLDVRRARAGPRGFTLIEILVVLMIIAIVVGFAMLKIGVTGRDTQLDDECRRIAGLLMLLEERAALEGRDFGVLIAPEKYIFVIFEQRRQRWEKFDEDREFRERELPKGLSFALELDSRNIVLNAAVSAPEPLNDANADADSTLNETENLVKPQVIVAASGDSTPFRLTLQRAGTTVEAHIAVDNAGKIKIEKSDAKRS